MAIIFILNQHLGHEPPFCGRSAPETYDFHLVRFQMRRHASSKNWTFLKRPFNFLPDAQVIQRLYSRFDAQQQHCNFPQGNFRKYTATAERNTLHQRGRCPNLRSKKKQACLLCFSVGRKKWNNWKLYFCLAYSFYASHVFIHKYLSVPLNTDISNNNIVIKKGN